MRRVDAFSLWRRHRPWEAVPPMYSWSTFTLADKFWPSYGNTSVTTRMSISPSRGFHITSSITVFAPLPSLKTCRTALLQLVPPDFIVDEYELDRRYQEGRGSLCHVVGEKDLELPVEAVETRSALVLIEFEASSKVKLDVPLHLRYAKPQKNTGSISAELPWPWVIAVCGQPEWDGRQFLRRFSRNESVEDYTVLFPPRDAPHPSSSIFVPTGNLSHRPMVEMGTVLSVFSMFLYISWCLFKFGRTANQKIKTR